MKAFRSLNTWASWTSCLALALLAAGCTTYRPLDAGSHVPWAQTAAGFGTAERQRQTAAIVRALKATPAPGRSGPAHRVERGESLAAIARRYGVDLRQLAAANDLGPPYTIYAGQMLQLPDGEHPPSDPIVRTAAQAAPSATVHLVRRGETLSGIARRYGVPARQLAQMNAIDPPYHLLAGQKLSIPGAGEVRVASRGDQQMTVPGSFEGDGFLWPVSGKVVGRFGRTEDGLRRDGIDIAARKGAPVRAAQAGVVVYAGDAIRGYGRMILLRHEGDYLTTYAHNSALLVNVGDRIERGQVIARMGERLHFELRKGRKAIDPEAVLLPLPTELASSE